jgi:hypothetical protein
LPIGSPEAAAYAVDFYDMVHIEPYHIAVAPSLTFNTSVVV